MTFQEFLATKRALAIVEHMETLSEDDARELFESLDDATVELIEQLLGEDIKATVKRDPQAENRAVQSRTGLRAFIKNNPNSTEAETKSTLSQVRDTQKYAKGQRAFMQLQQGGAGMDPRKAGRLQGKVERARGIKRFQPEQQ